MPTASSASAATVARATTTNSSATGVWTPLENYYGAPEPAGDLLLCALGYENYWSRVYPLTPLGDFRCVGPNYTANLGHYYTLWIFIS